MKKIYKYQLQIVEEQIVKMPGRPLLFKVGLDPGGDLCVWVLVNPEAVMRSQTIFVVGTGAVVPGDAQLWLGTVQRGAFMWHVFIP